MRFVPGKSADQQSVLILHRGRDALRKTLRKAFGAHLAEFGHRVAGQQRGHAGLRSSNTKFPRLPSFAFEVLTLLIEQMRDLENRIASPERRKPPARTVWR
jgi:transposase